MIPDMTCKQGPHVRTRPQTFRVPVSCIPFNSISGRHTPARNREAQSQTTAAYDRKEGLRHAHEKKNAVQCGVDVARGRKSHAGRYTCCTLKSGAFVTRKSVHHTWNLRVSAGSPTRRTVDMTQPTCGNKYRTKLRCPTRRTHRSSPPAGGSSTLPSSRCSGDLSMTYDIESS